MEEKRDVYAPVDPKHAGSLYGGVNRAIGLDFWMPSEQLFGLGEREDTLVLKDTDGLKVPYEMWAFDNPHEPDSINSLYGSLPQIQGISKTSSQSVTWVNSSHTYVFINDI